MLPSSAIDVMAKSSATVSSYHTFSCKINGRTLKHNYTYKGSILNNTESGYFDFTQHTLYHLENGPSASRLKFSREHFKFTKV